MLKQTKPKRYLRMLALLLGGLLLLTGCNTDDLIPNGDTSKEEISTSSQGTQPEEQTYQQTEEQTEEQTEPSTEEQNQPQNPPVENPNKYPWPLHTPVAPPAVVTQRNVGLADEERGSGTFGNGDRYFLAIVLETSEEAILVQPYGGTAERKIAERILVSIVNIAHAFDEGDLIRVVYQGEVTPGTPAKITASVRFETFVKGFGSETVPYFCTGALEMGYMKNSEIYTSSANLAKDGKSNIFRITSVEQLDEWLNLFACSAIDENGQRYQYRINENFWLSTYGEEYFAGNDLLLTYLVTGSGSNRFFAWDVTIANGGAELTVAQLSPLAGTADMAGWAVWIEVAKDAMKDVEFYQVNHIELIPGEVQELPSAEKCREMEDAALAFYGKELGINQPGSRVVYCGTYGDCNVITVLKDADQKSSKLIVNGHTFSYRCEFEILVERNGEFLPLAEAWDADWLLEIQLIYLDYNWRDYLFVAEILGIIPTSKSS